MANTTELTQWVCIGPTCLCLDGESEFECLCPDVVDGRCSNCGGAMHEINTDTGEPVAAAVGA
jgi:hypothetical protein